MKILQVLFIRAEGARKYYPGLKKDTVLPYGRSTVSGSGVQNMGLTKDEMIRISPMLVCRMEMFFQTPYKLTEKAYAKAP